MIYGSQYPNRNIARFWCGVGLRDGCYWFAVGIELVSVGCECWVVFGLVWLNLLQSWKGVNIMTKRILKRIGLALGGLAVSAAPLFAADAPIDLTSTAADLIIWITAAAGGALGIFAVMLGIRYIIRAFKTVK